MLRFLMIVWLALPVVMCGQGIDKQSKTPYQYFRVGAAQDVVTAPEAGYALMGGGTDLNEAFRWLCARAKGGDFLVLRARGTDAYNPYVAGLEDGKACKLNSVATLIIPSREAATNPDDTFVAETIAHAEAIFIAGGDQANYIRNWTGTPVQREVNAAIARGVPLGGTSAGLAVMGEWAYSAEGDKPDDENLDSKLALADPMGPRVTLVHGFLEIPVLKGILTDSHFVTRDRMGRLVAFLFRLNEPDGKETPSPSFTTRGVGIEQGAAILLGPDGNARVVGAGGAYFVRQTGAAFVHEKSEPLTELKVAVQKVNPGSEFDLKRWKGDASSYELAVEGRKVKSSQAGGSLY
jgi:cyanophycinase